MMGGVSPETCWAIKKHWNNKFYYTFASCCFFLWVSLLSFVLVQKRILWTWEPRFLIPKCVSGSVYLKVASKQVSFCWVHGNVGSNMYLRILYFSRRTFVSFAIVRKCSHCTAVPAESWGINWNESLASPIEGMFRMSRVWSICLAGCGMCVSERGCLARGAVGMNLSEQSVGRSVELVGANRHG